MNEHVIILNSSKEGVLYFDIDEAWFYFMDRDENIAPIGMARQGWFDLTNEECAAISNWIKGLLNNGLLHS